MTNSPMAMRDITGYLEYEEAERFVNSTRTLRNRIIIQSQNMFKPFYYIKAVGTLFLKPSFY